MERAYLAEAERRDVQMTRLSERLFVRAVTPADVAAYRAEHDDELRALFDANRQRWTDLEPQIHARHILIRATAGEPPQAAAMRFAICRLRRSLTAITVSRICSVDSCSSP